LEFEEGSCKSLNFHGDFNFVVNIIIFVPEAKIYLKWKKYKSPLKVLEFFPKIVATLFNGRFIQDTLTGQ